MDVMSQLNDLNKQQRGLEAQMREIVSQANDLKRRVAAEAATDLLKHLKAMGVEFKKGKVADLWGKVEEGLNTLKQTDENFFSSFSSPKNPYGLKFANEDEQRFVTNLVGNSLAKTPVFSKFLNHISSKDKPGNFFFRKEGD